MCTIMDLFIFFCVRVCWFVYILCEFSLDHVFFFSIVSFYTLSQRWKKPFHYIRKIFHSHLPKPSTLHRKPRHRNHHIEEETRESPHARINVARTVDDAFRKSEIFALFTVSRCRYIHIYTRACARAEIRPRPYSGGAHWLQQVGSLRSDKFGALAWCWVSFCSSLNFRGVVLYTWLRPLVKVEFRRCEWRRWLDFVFDILMDWLIDWVTISLSNQLFFVTKIVLVSIMPC